MFWLLINKNCVGENVNVKYSNSIEQQKHVFLKQTNEQKYYNKKV